MILLNKSKFQISIITAVYNRKDILKRAIESLQEQIFSDFEHIIVDDGSVDNLYSSYVKYFKHDNVKYIRHTNRNTPLSLNTGIKLASGRYITFLDSDDEYKPEHLESRVEYFSNHKSTDLSYSNADIFGSKEQLLIPDAKNPNKLIHLNKCVIGATIFGKRKVFLGLNGFKDIYGYDYDFIQRSKLRYKVRKLNLPTYLYHRETPDSVLTSLKRNIF